MLEDIHIHCKHQQPQTPRLGWGLVGVEPGLGSGVLWNHLHLCDLSMLPRTGHAVEYCTDARIDGAGNPGKATSSFHRGGARGRDVSSSDPARIDVCIYASCWAPDGLPDWLSWSLFVYVLIFPTGWSSPMRSPAL